LFIPHINISSEAFTRM